MVSFSQKPGSCVFLYRQATMDCLATRTALEWHTSTLCARQAHTYHELDKKFNSKINLICF